MAVLSRTRETEQIKENFKENSSVNDFQAHETKIGSIGQNFKDREFYRIDDNSVTESRSINQ